MRAFWFVFVYVILFCSSESEVITVDVHAAKKLLNSGHRYLDVRYCNYFSFLIKKIRNFGGVNDSFFIFTLNMLWWLFENANSETTFCWSLKDRLGRTSYRLVEKLLLSQFRSKVLLYTQITPGRVSKQVQSSFRLLKNRYQMSSKPSELFDRASSFSFFPF